MPALPSAERSRRERGQPCLRAGPVPGVPSARPAARASPELPGFNERVPPGRLSHLRGPGHSDSADAASDSQHHCRQRLLCVLRAPCRSLQPSVMEGQGRTGRAAPGVGRSCRSRVCAESPAPGQCRRGERAGAGGEGATGEAWAGSCPPGTGDLRAAQAACRMHPPSVPLPGTPANTGSSRGAAGSAGARAVRLEGLCTTKVTDTGTCLPCAALVLRHGVCRAKYGGKGFGGPGAGAGSVSASSQAPPGLCLLRVPFPAEVLLWAP